MESTAAPILALHGLGGGAYELTPLLDALRDAGHSVTCPALPGHADEGLVMPASHWEDWLAEAKRNLDSHAGSATIIGFSTGGTLALELAITNPERVARMVLICPFLAVRHRWFYGFTPEQYLRSPLTSWLVHVPRRPPAIRDPAASQSLALARGPATRYRTFNLSAARTSLHLIKRVRERVQHVLAPTLILQARHDSVVEPAQAAWLLDRVGSSEKRLVWLEKSDHLAAWDYDRRQVIDETLAFLLTQSHPPSA
jgi:carboxylesterase